MNTYHSKFALLLACILPIIGAQGANLTDYGASPALTRPPEDQNAANEKLDFHTDLFTGRFGYNVPIQVPSARGGTEPGISLQYSSANKNGWCGVGWDLDMGSIERETRNGVPVGSTSYSDSYGFTFSVGGQSGRLISTGGSNYSPQIDTSFLKCVFSNNVWVCTDKSGRQYNFGEANSSRITNSLGTFRWSLSSIHDPNGNNTFLTYTNDGTVTNGQRYLKEIDYNGNDNGISTNCAVVLDLTNRLDIVSSAISGSEIAMQKRLGSIRVYSQGSLVRRYQLAYAYSPSSGRSLLQTVTEYGTDNSTHLPAQTFSYTQQSASFQYPPVAWGVRPEVPDSPGTSFSIAPGNIDNAIIDIDGDGLPDWVTVADGNGNPFNYYNVKLNTGSGFGSLTSWSTLSDESGTNPKAFGQVDSTELQGTVSISDVSLLDMNRDGLPDRLMRQYLLNGHPDHFQVQTNTGTGFGNRFSLSTVQNLNGVYADSSMNYPFVTDSSGVGSLTIMADMNGDGLPDRVMLGSANGRFDVQLNQGDGTLAGLSAWNNVDGTVGSFPYAPRYRDASHVYSELIDMNGDGLPDRFTANGVRLNKGTGSFYVNSLGWNLGGADPETVNVTDGNYAAQLIDMNGDGLPDYVTSSGTGSYSVFFNTGRGFTNAAVTWNNVDIAGGTGYKNLQGWDSAGVKVMFIDMDGDGLVDRVERAYTNGINAIFVQLNSGPFPDLLDGVDNGIGGSVAVSYLPSTAYNNSDGVRQRMPFPVYTVSSVTVTDSHGNSGTSGYTTSYVYANGLYDTTYREFRGFGFVTQTNASGSYSLNWFHQGGGTNGTSLGEFRDDLSKAGMPYRVEKYGMDKKLYTRTVNKVASVLVQTNGVYFPFLAQVLNQDFEGNTGTTNYRATAQEFTYSAISNNLASSTGNLLGATNYGEVGGINISNHTFSVSNTVPPFYTLYTYASISANPNIIDRVSNRTISSDSAGSAILRQTTYTYVSDATGNVLTRNDLVCPGTFATTSYTYDSYGNVLTVTDPVGVVTTTEYDAATATYPTRKYTGLLADNLIESASYDSRSGVVILATNMQGLVTSNAYDVFFRPSSTRVSTNANGTPTLIRTKYEYILGGITGADNSSNFVHSSTIDPADTTTGFHESYTFFDGLGRTIQTRDESEVSGQYRVANIAYDVCGGVTLQEYPFFDSQALYKKYTTTRTNVYTEYDPIDRPFRVNPVATSGQNSGGWWNGNSVTVSSGDSSSPLGPTSTAFKDGTNPWMITVTNALGKIHKYSLDAYGRTNQIIEVTSAGNFTTALAYNQVNDLTNITDNANNRISLFYDLAGRKVAVADPDMGFWQYGLDAAGRLKVQTDAKGQQIKLFYSDDAGRLTRREGWTASGQCVSTNTYQYDSNGGDSAYTVYPGQLFSVADDEGWQKNSYDVRDRTTKTVRYLIKNGRNYTNQVTFDDADRVTSQAYPNGGPTITNLYDLGEHLSQVQQVGGAGTLFFTAKGFNGLGQSLGVNFGNGVQTTNSYFLISKRLNQILSSKTGNIQNLTYAYDAGGNFKGITDGVYSGTNSATLGNIQYDELNRLTSLTNTSGAFSYGFDSVGNLTTNQESGVSNYVYGTSRPHAVTKANGGWYTYDQNGNVVFRIGQRLDYDVNNRLVRVWGTNGVLTTFGYDGGGSRLWKQSGTNTLQVWIGGDYEEKNGQTLFHISAGGQTICTFDSTGTNVFQYYQPNNLSSTSIQTDTNGNLVQHYEYSAFGQTRLTLSATAFPVSRRYTGQILDDDTGLYYYNARYYDPQLARFTQPDDIIPDVFNPQSYNRYSYCLGNPLRFTDPNGHEERLWYDRLAAWSQNNADISKNAINNSTPVWLATTFDTVIDLGHGLAAFPSALGHVGEGSGKFSVEPTLENAAGVASDVSIVFGTAATGMAPLPSLRPTVPTVAPPKVEPTPEAPAPKLLPESTSTPRTPNPKLPGKTIDPTTGQEVQRFIVDPNGNAMIEPVGGTTKPWGRGGADTHTTYPNDSPFQRLDNSHGPTHGHGHLPGTGPGKAGTGPSLDQSGNVVPNTSSEAHWPVKKN